MAPSSCPPAQSCGDQGAARRAQPDAAQPTGGGAVPVPNGENGHAAGGATDGATNSVLLRRVTQLQKENETLRAQLREAEDEALLPLS